MDLSRNIDSLTGLIVDQKARDLEHQERMKSMGLTQLGIENQARSDMGRMGLEKSKLERQRWLEEPVTAEQFFMTLPGRTPEQNRQVLGSVPKEILSDPTLVFPRMAWGQQLQQMKQSQAQLAQKNIDAQARAAESQLDRQSRENMTGRRIASAEKIAGMRTEKSDLPPMAKEIAEIRRIKGGTEQEAYNEWKNTKTLADRIRLYNNEVDRLFDDFRSSPEEKKQKMLEFRSLYGIDEVTGSAPSGSTGIDIKSLVEKGRAMRGGK